MEPPLRGLLPASPGLLRHANVVEAIIGQSGCCGFSLAGQSARGPRSSHDLRQRSVFVRHTFGIEAFGVVPLPLLQVGLPFGFRDMSLPSAYVAAANTN